MLEGLIDSAAAVGEPDDRRIFGVTLAYIIDNLDLTGQGRVQVHLPWLPGFAPWARLAVLDAGDGRGTCFIPQVGDEVLVAFNHGDVREPYVVGSLWNGQNRPPTTPALDPVHQRLIRTPQGHEIAFDDAMQSLKVTSVTGQTITLDPTGIELTTAGKTSSIVLGQDGRITLRASVSIELDAPTITVQGAQVEITGTASASLGGGASCSVQAGLVMIN